MADRNTHITKRQIGDQAVDVPDLETTNSASDKQVPSYDSASGKFKWVDALIALWTGYTEKTTPTANDIFLINDSDASNVLKKTLWSDIKTTLKIYFDGLYKATFAYTAEDVANKSTNVTTDGASDTKYPSVKAVKTYVDNSVIGLLDYRGGYNASGNTYPTTGGSGTEGAILKGDLWIISVAGTLGGVAVQVGDAIVALVDTPGQTSTNWNSLNGNIAYVPEDVANKSTDGTLADNSTIKYPSQSAVKTYADGKLSKSTAGEINALTNKSTPVDADVIVGEDSANSWSKIKIILSNLKSYLKTYFDTLYIAITAPANGDMIYYNNGAWQRLSIGTVGQTLKINWDAFTKAMLHCDGIQGSTSFIDEIGKSITNIDALTKLLCYFDGSQGGVAFTDSETTPKTITNTVNYDQYTKLMLHLDNNVTDSATAKTVTNTNVTFSNTIDKWGYSGVFNGTNAYLSLADNADWNFGSGAFTIDGWYSFNDNIAGQYLWGNYKDGNNYKVLAYNPYTIQFSEVWVGGYTIRFTCPFSPTINTFYHIALIRGWGGDVNTWAITINGVHQPLTLLAGSYSVVLSNMTPGLWYIGARNNGYYFFNGWQDELRISKGIARWTSDFVVPTAPFGQVYVDTSVKKFGTGSARCLGGGEYLSLVNSADWALGSANFTIDAWVCFNQLDGYQTILGSWGQTSDSYMSKCAYVFAYDNSTHSVDGLAFMFSTDGTKNTVSILHRSWTPTLNTWYHLAVVRSGTNVYFFVNGTQLGATYTGITQTIYTPTNGMYSGTYNPADTQIMSLDGGTSNFLNGNIDELRVSKGLARWTANFTPPTSAYTVGVICDTTKKEFGTGSAFFDGGSYLTLADSADWNFGSNPFTIDFWGSVRDNTVYQYILGQYVNANTYLMCCYRSDNKLQLSVIESGVWTLTFTCSFTPTVDTLYHIAYVRVNNDNADTGWRIFINGVSQSLTKLNGNWNATMPDLASLLCIGSMSGSDGFYSGNVDEFRISTGIARWTSNFTPPTAPYSILPIWST